MRPRYTGRSFPGPSALRRARQPRTAWPRLPETAGGGAQAVSRGLSLGLACGVVAGLVYALLKFFGMMRTKHLDVRDLWFVPAVMLAVMLVLLVRVVRPLLKEILTKPPRK
ncbi:MAG: hypothetical protein JW952_01610 [Candidatus Eisenbacteria bacterium]|nr:hypothetical protein [Candidatus Eisenbacteria bacterium]